MPSDSMTPEQFEKAATMLKALAHPVQIAIMNVPWKVKMLIVRELRESLRFAQAAASQHLSIMKDKGILSSKREGKNIYYYTKDLNLFTIVDCAGRYGCY